MPTTIITDATLGVFAIGARTDAAGAAVDDVSAEELRYVNQVLTPGVVEPADGWKVSQRAAGANMSVDVGSGVAKADYAVVQGVNAGQGRYLVRGSLATVNVLVPAAHVSLARTDEAYLLVAAAPYDSGSVSLPRIGYRQGDAGGGAPGPDAGWDAYLLLATVAVAANETAIETAHITDGRVMSVVTTAGGAAVPTGAMVDFGGAAAPAGWLLCDGAAVSRTTYARLFVAIGIAYGAGDGSTTFQVPNLSGRFALGKAVSGTGAALGASGGSIDHGHSVNIPSTSTSSAGSHAHTAPSPGTDIEDYEGEGSSFGADIASAGAHTHTVDPGAVNSDTDNPPFLVVNKIIRT